MLPAKIDIRGCMEYIVLFRSVRSKHWEGKQLMDSVRELSSETVYDVQVGVLQ